MIAPVPLERLNASPQRYVLEFSDADRAEIARRLSLVALDELRAELDVRRTAGGAEARGRVLARAVQSCSVSAEPVPAEIDEELALRFAPLAEVEADELELGEDDLDVAPLDGDRVDLAGAVADTLALALDPFPRADQATLAEARTRLLTEEQAAELARQARNPFTVLKRAD